MTSDGTTNTVTLRIHRFSPKTDGNESRQSGPFGSRARHTGSPFDRIDAAASSSNRHGGSPFDRSEGNTPAARTHRGGSPFDRPSRRRGGSPFGNSSSPEVDDHASLKARHQQIRGRRWTQDYTIETRPTDTLLDCLMAVKRTLDPSLTFRYSCGHGVCGSDAVAVNGTPTLLCTATVAEFAKQPRETAGVPSDQPFRKTQRTASGGPESSDDQTSAFTAMSTSAATSATTSINPDTGEKRPAQTGAVVTSPQATPTPQTGASLGVVEIGPLPGFPVVRDLIVDIDQMMDQIKSLTPYLKADGRLATTAEGKIDMFEYLQSPEELRRIELLSNCISCGVCEGSCPVYAGGEAFVGPAALVSASRFINDSRDTATAERLEAIAAEDGIAACQSVRACSRRCPRGIDVGEEMWRLTERVNAR